MRFFSFDINLFNHFWTFSVHILMPSISKNKTCSVSFSPGRFHKRSQTWMAYMLLFLHICHNIWPIIKYCAIVVLVSYAVSPFASGSCEFISVDFLFLRAVIGEWPLVELVNISRPPRLYPIFPSGKIRYIFSR